MVIKASVLFIFDNMLPKTSVTGHPYSKEKSLFFLNFALQQCHRLCLTFHYATVYTLGHLEFGQTCLNKVKTPQLSHYDFGPVGSQHVFTI